jgi:hypothetical protein
MRHQFVHKEKKTPTAMHAALSIQTNYGFKHLKSDGEKCREEKKMLGLNQRKDTC